MTKDKQNEPTPTKKLANALSELDTLDSMRDQLDFDADTAAELRADVLGVIDEVFATNPDLASEMNPVIARAERARALAKTARAAAEARLLSPTKPNPLLDYQKGSLYERLSEKSQHAIDQVMLNLLEGDTLEDTGNIVSSPDEAADKLGLDREDVERAYGLLSSIEDNPAVDDIIEFMAVNFADGHTGEGKTPGVAGDGEGELGGGLSDNYIARVRRSSERTIISIVLDAVPPENNNAVYILRNDDQSIESVESSFTSKVEARARGARRVYHREETGEAGVLKRINKWLTVPFEKFKDPDATV